MVDTPITTDTDDTMDHDHVPNSEQCEASSSKKGQGGSNKQSLKSGPRIPTSPKHKEEEEVSIDTQFPNAERVAEDAEPVENDDNGSDRNDEKIEGHTCEVCGKSFPSRQVLFGHMKVHDSGKTSKEAKKEAKKKENSNSEVHALDVDLCNIKWQRRRKRTPTVRYMTDKRGRERKDVTGPLTEQVNAALILNSMKEPKEYSERRCLGVDLTDGKVVARVSRSDNQGIEKFEISGWGATMRVKPVLPEAEDTHNGDSTKDSTKLDTGDDVHGDTETKENCTMVTSPENEDCGNAESSRSKTTGSYICRICRKRFKSFQALGGHMGHCKKGDS